MLIAFFLLIVIVTSLINIYAYWIEDGLIGRLLYMGCVFTAGAGLFHIINDKMPVFIYPTLIALFALKSIRHLCAKYMRYFKYRSIYAKKHIR